MNPPSSPDRSVVRLWLHDLAGDSRTRVDDDRLATLSADELARCRRFRRDADRLAYAAAHALLYRALAQTLGLPRTALAIARDALGRPYLAAPAASGVDFSLSHTDGLVAVAVSTAGRVGVDVEACDRHAIPVEELGAFGLNAAQRSELAALAEPARRQRFFAWWTACEAVAKADGRGLSLPFAQITVDLERNRAAISPQAGGDRLDWRLWRQSPSPRHRLALACADGSPLRHMGTLLERRHDDAATDACRT